MPFTPSVICLTLMLIISVSSSLSTTTSILQGLRDLEGRWEKGSDRAKKANSIQVTKKISVWARRFVCTHLDVCAAFCRSFCRYVPCLLFSGHVNKLMRLLHSSLFRRVLPAAVSAWTLGFKEACERHCSTCFMPLLQSLRTEGFQGERKPGPCFE